MMASNRFICILRIIPFCIACNDKNTKSRCNTSVTAGDKIATADNSGNSSGTHLHLEVREKPGGKPIDPTTYLGKCP